MTSACALTLFVDGNTGPQPLAPQLHKMTSITLVLDLKPLQRRKGRRWKSALSGGAVKASLDVNKNDTQTRRLVVETNVKTGVHRHLNIENLSKNNVGSGLLQPFSIRETERLGDPTSWGSTLKSLFLPAGWPNSVTKDYLLYQLWTFPSHVTGWMSHSLAGSSMLKALGISGGAATAVGFTAAIKWVTKDGVGAAGRLFVGARLSDVFDEDPRRWRMIAEGITTIGLALEITTQLSPSNFVALAGAGTLAKAMGKGMGRPSFRVIQNHFASGNNVGDIAAKEEVWEVAAQMAGLAASVGVLRSLENAGVPEAVVPVWAAIHMVHVALRYVALQKLRFPYPNFKRGASLVTTHVKEGRVITLEEANLGEPVMRGPDRSTLPCELGCSLETLIHLGNSETIEDLIFLYDEERYILSLSNDSGTSRIYVCLWEDARPIDVLKAMWQTAWVDCHLAQQSIEGNDLNSNSLILKDSLCAMQREFPNLEKRATELGWELDRGVFPLGSYRLCRDAPCSPDQ